MAKILAVTNQKGGVGKTTTAINLSASLGFFDKRVLLIDFDPQSNSTIGLGIRKEQIEKEIFDVLLNEANIKDVILRTSTKNVDIIPSTVELSGIDIKLAKSNEIQKNYLKEQLKTINAFYDYIIIDCPPTLGILNRNALATADSVIIPIQAEFYALEGLTQLLSTIKLVKRIFNKNLKIEGIVLTMYDTRALLSHEVEADVRKFFDNVYETKIPRSVKLAEAPSVGLSIIDYEPKSKGAIAYLALAKEIINSK